MSEPTQPSTAETMPAPSDGSPAGPAGLLPTLDSALRGLTQLDEVLKAMFAMYADKGIQPTYHVTGALDKMHKRLKEAHDVGQGAMRQLDQLRELVRTSALITSSLDLDQVLGEVMDTVIHLLQAERAYLMLYDDQKDLQIRSARNWDKQSLDESEARFSQSIVDAAIKDGQPIITTNAQTDERFGSRESIVVQQLRSIICVPLAMRGQTIGVLYADSRYTQDLFTAEIAPLLTAFGTQASIAISNAKAFAKVKDNLEEAQAEIHRLRIEIDRKKMDTQVGEITGSEYFQKLSANAKEIRQKREETGSFSTAESPNESMTEKGAKKKKK